MALREAVSLRRQLSSSRAGARRSDEHAPKHQHQQQQEQQQEQRGQGAKQNTCGAPHGASSNCGVSISASAGHTPSPPTHGSTGFEKGTHVSGGVASRGSPAAVTETHGSPNEASEPGRAAWLVEAMTRGSHAPNAAGGGSEAQPTPSVVLQAGLARGASREEGDGAAGAAAVVDWSREVLQGG